MQNLNSDKLRRQLDENNAAMNKLAEDNQKIVELLAERGLQAIDATAITTKTDGALCKTTIESLRKLGEQLMSSGLVSVGIADREEDALSEQDLTVYDWWCSELSAKCAEAMINLGLSLDLPSGWEGSPPHECCFSLSFSDQVRRDSSPPPEAKQIHRRGNSFYWGAP